MAGPSLTWHGGSSAKRVDPVGKAAVLAGRRVASVKGAAPSHRSGSSPGRPSAPLYGSGSVGEEPLLAAYCPECAERGNSVFRDGSTRAKPALSSCGNVAWSELPQAATFSAARSSSSISIFFISSIAAITRCAFSVSGSLRSLISTVGVICQDKPNLSLSQPHAPPRRPRRACPSTSRPPPGSRRTRRTRWPR